MKKVTQFYGKYSIRSIEKYCCYNAIYNNGCSYTKVYPKFNKILLFLYLKYLLQLSFFCS